MKHVQRPCAVVAQQLRGYVIECRVDLYDRGQCVTHKVEELSPQVKHVIAMREGQPLTAILLCHVTDQTRLAPLFDTCQTVVVGY